MAICHEGDMKAALHMWKLSARLAGIPQPTSREAECCRTVLCRQCAVLVVVRPGPRTDRLTYLALKQTHPLMIAVCTRVRKLVQS